MTICLTTSYYEEKINEIVGNTWDKVLYDNPRTGGTEFIFLNLNVSTTNISVYTHETMKELIWSLEDGLTLKKQYCHWKS
jgi:hypothetical protein